MEEEKNIYTNFGDLLMSKLRYTGFGFYFDDEDEIVGALKILRPLAMRQTIDRLEQEKQEQKANES